MERVFGLTEYELGLFNFKDDSMPRKAYWYYPAADISKKYWCVKIDDGQWSYQEEAPISLYIL